MFYLNPMRYIVNSLLDVDFYQFTMGQLAFHLFRNLTVRYELILRNVGVNLLDEIDFEQLKKEIAHVRTLRFNPSQISYLRGIDEYGKRMFKEDFLSFLSNLQLPMPDIEVHDGKLYISVTGKWCEAIYWETIILCIISELRSRKCLEGKSAVELEVIRAKGITDLITKTDMINEAWDSGIIFSISDFSTRRRAFYDFQELLVQILAERLTRKFPDGRPLYRGTSNVELAYKYGQLPMGTISHQAYMVYSKVYDNGNETDLVYSQRKLIEDWDNEYPSGALSMDLPDTYGTPFFLYQVLTEEIARAHNGFRQDSGNPYAIGKSYIDFYQSLRINPKEKLVLFSDGLKVPTMIGLAKVFMDPFKTVGMGPGSNFSNDFGFDSRSMVMKVVAVEGKPVVKLSDNLDKSTGGDPVEKERVIRQSGYHNNFHEAPTY